ncbi:MAG: MATE family efflux transporter [Lachnospiraceae bacterium]|nr:MATE family efflux transporter [Lachnospiraceae bacterium]
MEKKAESKVGMDLTQGSVFRVLFVFAVPIILTSLVQQVYSMVDLIVIGRYMGSEGTVGVSVGGEMADLVAPAANAFASAGQIYIAQLCGFGGRGKKELSEVIGTLLSMLLILALLFMGVTIFGRDALLRLLNCPEEALRSAGNYMLITALGFPFIFGYNGLCSILRGLGESQKPLLFICVASVINVAADIVFVFGFRMGTAGTALATIMSQAVSFLMALGYLYRHRHDEFSFDFRVKYFMIKPRLAVQLLKLSLPTLLKTCLVHTSMIWVNSNINAYSLTASATNSIGNKIQRFVELFVQGTDVASGTIIGQNLGAGRHDRARDTVLYTLRFSLTIATIATFAFLVFPRQLFWLFTTDPAVVELGVLYLHITILTVYLSAVTSSFQSMVTGSGFVLLNFALGILDGVVSRIGFSLLFLYIFDQGVVSFFLGTAFSRSLTAAVVIVYFFSGRWRSRKLVISETR